MSGPGHPTEATARDRHLAELAVIGVMVLWAGNFIVVKSAVATLPPVGFTFLRFTLASATLFLLLRWREGSIGLPRRDLLAIMGFGALGFGVYQILWTTGLTTVPAGDSALIIAATPVLVALIAVVARTDVLTPTKLAGVLLSFAGVAAVIASGPGLTLGGTIVGELITLGAALCWSIYTAYATPYVRRYSPLRATAWGSLAGTIVLAPLAAFQLSGVEVASLTPDVLVAILYSGFLAAGVSNVIVMNGVKVLGPTRTSALQFLVPALAVALAAVLLDEAIRPGQIVGGIVIVAGVLLTRWQRPGRATAPRTTKSAVR
ncbi:MAG TPA: DMT family transporter [Candidatus Limnocylindrales bacterium]|nr:DMT family transporter [Candidatus Limnocylindrales bacterium]